MNEHLYAVIMAGGLGSRLWPRSRTATPKQFLDLLGPRTMLQATVDRIQPLIPLERLLVVVSEDHGPVVQHQLPALPSENILLEPGPRGTAPCIGLAAVALEQRDPEAIMAVFPADHLIADAAGFRRAIAAAAQIAEDGFLVTLGITPDHPNTGYGYIQRGTPLSQTAGLAAYRVARFTEKPDAATARQFVAEGQYYWNGGIFVWRVATILAEMASQLGDLYSGLRVIAKAWGTPHLAETLTAVYQHLPSTTIDYGVMEKSTQVAVLPVDVGWNDVGSWASLAELVQGDEAGNVVRGGGRHLLIDTTDTYVHTAGGRLIAAVGLEGLIVVDTPDALLICPKDRAQAVREIVDRLKADGLGQHL